MGFGRSYFSVGPVEAEISSLSHSLHIFGRSLHFSRSRRSRQLGIAPVGEAGSTL